MGQKNAARKISVPTMFFPEDGIFPSLMESKKGDFIFSGGLDMTLSAVEVNDLKQAPATEGVLPVLLDRWSARSFADREVSPAELRKVFEAARWSASAYNEQ